MTRFCFVFLLCFQLLEKKKRVQLKDIGEDLECLCQIMRTVGPRLDHEKAKVKKKKSVVFKAKWINNAGWATLCCGFASFSTS